MWYMRVNDMVSVDDFISGKMDYFNFIFTITGFVRPAGYTLGLSASVLLSVRCGEKGESVAYAQFSSLCIAAWQNFRHPQMISLQRAQQHVC